VVIHYCDVVPLSGNICSDSVVVDFEQKKIDLDFVGVGSNLV